ncbi:hypothetical protein ES708_26080 [subsurface metagenome]
MAKPKSPLLSLGARGSIGDTLTFQKRGRLTIARTKPIPTDPKSPAQLAWRQIYRDAVASWNSLTPEEKEAWRGVCPGLTDYQCFMRAELKNVEPTPPPEEYTEEQTDHTSPFGTQYHLYSGQRLFILERKVSKLGFWMMKTGSPAGDVFFQILSVEDDGILVSKKWGIAQDLPSDAPEYKEVEFEAPVLIDEEVRILTFFDGVPSTSHYVITRVQNTDVKENEHATRGKPSSWIPGETNDAAYRYKYYLP